MSETLLGHLTLATGGAFPLSTDTMVLADFVRPSPRARICDLGMGGGALSLLLAGQYPSTVLTGVELDEAAYALARHNIQTNNLDGRITAIHGDLRSISSLLPANGFDCVVSNPPYFPLGGGKPHSTHEAARAEATCSLAELCNAAAWLLRFGGTFCLVYRPERLCDLMVFLRAAKLEPKRLQFVRHSPSSKPSLVLVEAKLGGKPGLQMLQDLCLFQADGTPSANYRRIYHLEGDALP